jgi:hypothetical protein
MALVLSRRAEKLAADETECSLEKAHTLVALASKLMSMAFTCSPS